MRASLSGEGGTILAVDGVVATGPIGVDEGLGGASGTGVFCASSLGSTLGRETGRGAMLELLGVAGC